MVLCFHIRFDVVQSIDFSTRILNYGFNELGAFSMPFTLSSISKKSKIEIYVGLDGIIVSI
jgi:hypothetical protein